MCFRRPTDNYLGVITPQEIENLRNSGPGGQTHPVVRLACAERGDQVAANTEMAGRLVFDKNQGWLQDLRPRLLATDDFTQASSALGEIRAYGALLETWMTVTPAPSVPGSNASPEFEVDGRDGQVIVEVHSRQLDNMQGNARKDFHSDLDKKHEKAVERARDDGWEGNVVTSDFIEVFPTGAPQERKKGDFVLTNTISRIAAIKEKEHQIDPKKPFVLWLDLQDPDVWMLPLSEELFKPLFTESKEGVVRSGPFWFALYGRKDSSLIVESCGYSHCLVPMAHEGRFRQIMHKSHGGPTRISAVVYSLPKATILMEHPKPAQPLPPLFRASILKAPFFRLDLSLMEWEPGLVAASVDLQHHMIRVAEQALRRAYISSNFDVEDMVRSRAYHRWEAEGRKHGNDWSHWFQAEKELEFSFD